MLPFFFPSTSRAVEVCRYAEAALVLLREPVQSTDVCFQEETALFQYRRQDVSDSFEFRLSWDGTLNFFNSNLLFIVDETSGQVELFCMCRVQMVEKSPFKYCFNL